MKNKINIKDVDDIPLEKPKFISSFLRHWRKKYDIDMNYQRAPGAWTKKQEQYLIDTILRGYRMPPIFIHKKDGKNWIVDGQHRILTIENFSKNDLKLNEDFSDDIIKDCGGGRIYDDLVDKYIHQFDEYPLPFIGLEDYDDEEIRSLFKRLQSGTSLSTGEKLNAYSGKIVPTMRTLGHRKFFTKILPFGIKRYLNYKMAATFLYLENNGILDINVTYIYDFFERFSDLDESSNEFRKVNKVLKLLEKILDENMAELRNQAWVISVYLFVSELINENYAVEKKKEDIKSFLIKFYDKVEKSDTDIDRELIDFDRESSRGTTSKKSIQFRHDILLDRFFSVYELEKRDEQRLFDREQKREIYRRDREQCRICSRKLTFGDKNTHYHHRKLWIDTGKTEVENGMLVCKDCHLKKIHGK